MFGHVTHLTIVKHYTNADNVRFSAFLCLFIQKFIGCPFSLSLFFARAFQNRHPGKRFFLILDLSFKMPSLFFVNDVHCEVYSDSCSKQCSLLFYFKACTLKKYISCLEAIQIVPILCFVFVGCAVLCIFVNISCRCYFFLI